MTIKQQGGIFGRNPTFNNVEIDGGVSLGDNKTISFGDAEDLTIYHDGTKSIIKDSGTGNLELHSSAQVVLWNADRTKVLAAFRDGEYNRFYYNNIPRLETTNTGALVSGDLAFPAGNGIDFSATSGTGTSELFSDYEEGSWTPDITDGSNSASGTIEGSYTKVGRLVTVSVNVRNLNTSGLTAGNDLKVENLPFAVGSSTSHRSIGAARLGNIGVSSPTSAVCYASNSATEFILTSPDGNIIVSDVTSGSGNINLTLSYQTS